MAMTMIGELSQARRFSIDNKLVRRATRAFMVRSDGAVRGGIEAAIAVGVDFGDPYRTLNTESGEFEYDTGLEVDNVDSEPYDPEDYTIWKVTVSYSSNPPEPAQFTAGGATNINTAGGGGSDPAGGDGQNESPLAEPAKIVWSRRNHNQAMYLSRDTPPKKFVNSAGTPFSRSAEFDEGVLILTITRNESSYNATDRELYWNTVNEWPFYGFLTEAVLCEDITGFRDYRNKTQFWPVTYRFAINSAINYWHWRPVDKGPEYLDAGGNRKRAIEGAGHTKEVLLDGAGGRNPEASDPTILDFTIYPQMDFGPLDLE